MIRNRVWLVAFTAILWTAAYRPESPTAASSMLPPSARSAETKAALSADPVYDEIAAFLAGSPCAGSPYRKFQATEEYRAFVAALDESWAAMDAERLSPIRIWSEREIAEARTLPTTVFYPFGGPDALTPLVFFPEARHYLLLGLEFPGRLPEFRDVDDENASRYVQNLQSALGDFFKKSYFITKNMNEKLADDKVDGVLPLLSFFLKRSGYTISSIQRLEFGENGEAVLSPYPGEKKRRRRPFGIHISFFAEGADVPRELTYISCDLENKAFQEEQPLFRYLRGLPLETTFVKSASYLMHYKEFSQVRDLIMARSRFILQDDTGIPFRFFPQERWDVRLYGTFVPPVADFKNVDQPDLREAFETSGKARPLPFPLGYHWGTKKDSLLFIVKK